MSKKSTQIGVGKKVLASALSAAMVVAFAPAVAMAGEPGETNEDATNVMAADVHVSTADDLVKAVREATDGRVVVLDADIDLTNLLVIGNGINVHIDLNTHTLSRSSLGNTVVYLNGGRGVISGGTISAKEYGIYAVGGSLDVKGVTINAPMRCLNLTGDAVVNVDKESSFIKSSYSDGETAAVVLYKGETANDPTLNFDGTVRNESEGFAISGNGSNSFKPTIKLGKNAKVISTKDYAIYQPQGGYLIVDGSTIEGVGGIEAKAGNIEIKNQATISATSVSASHDPNNGGSSTSGYAVALVENANYVDGAAMAVVDASTIAGQMTIVKDSNSANPASLSIKSGTFTDIANAVKYADNGASLTLGANAVAGMSIPAGKNITLDLGGYTLSRDGGSVFDIYGGLVLKNGTVNMTYTPAAGKPGTSAVWLNQNAKMTLERDAKVVTDNSNFGISYWSDCDGAELTLRGAVEGGNGITVNGYVKTANKLTVDGATISVTGHGIYQAGRADTSFTVKNSKISGSTGIEVRAGKLIVDNCEITGGKEFNSKANGSGTTTDGAGIAIVQHTTKQNIDVTIDGGKISGAKAIYENNLQGNDEEDIAKVKLSVKGGTFTGPIESQNLKSFITGGTFSTDPTAYLASGYSTYKSGDNWVVYVPSSGGGSVTPTPTPKPDPEPTPTPEPAAPGTNVSGTDASGNTVEATVTDNEKVELPDGTEAAGSVEYKGVTGSGSSEPASSADIPASVTSSDGTVYAVTKIADNAFSGQSQLKSVSIPETVVEVGSNAFANTGIESVRLPAATSILGKAAFKGCASLKTADISAAALTSIPADAFNGAAISSIDIPGSVKTIGARAFKSTGLEGVSTNAKTVAKSAFAACASLKTASLPKATELGAYALSGTALKSVSLPKVKVIGDAALKDAGKLKALTTGTALEEIGSKALAGTKVKTLTVKSKRLTAKGVKGSLKGSKVTKVEVAVTGSKKTQDNYVSKYREMFKKANSGKSVKVVKAKKTTR